MTIKLPQTINFSFQIRQPYSPPQLPLPQEVNQFQHHLKRFHTSIHITSIAYWNGVKQETNVQWSQDARQETEKSTSVKADMNGQKGDSNYDDALDPCKQAPIEGTQKQPPERGDACRQSLAQASASARINPSEPLSAHISLWNSKKMIGTYEIKRFQLQRYACNNINRGWR